MLASDKFNQVFYGIKLAFVKWIKDLSPTERFNIKCSFPDSSEFFGDNPFSFTIVFSTMRDGPAGIKSKYNYSYVVNMYEANYAKVSAGDIKGFVQYLVSEVHDQNKYAYQQKDKFLVTADTVTLSNEALQDLKNFHGIEISGGTFLNSDVESITINNLENIKFSANKLVTGDYISLPNESSMVDDESDDPDNFADSTYENDFSFLDID